MRILYIFFATLLLHFFTITPICAFSFWNTLDYITQEKDYLYVRNMAKSMQQSVANLPMDKSEVVSRLKDSTALSQWLQEPTGKFGDLYQEQMKNQFKELDYIHSWTIYNEHKAVLLSQGERLPVETISDQVEIHLSGFSIPLYKNDKLLGYAQAKWNLFLPSQLPTISNASTSVASLWFNEQKKVIGKIPNSFQNFVEDNSYKGIQNGRKKDLRFYSVGIDNHVVVFLYSAASYSFYIWRMGIYLFILMSLILIYFLLQKYLKQNAKTQLYSWADEKLEAIGIEQETFNPNNPSHSILLEKEKTEQVTAKSFLEPTGSSIEEQSGLSNDFEKTSLQQNDKNKKSSIEETTATGLEAITAPTQQSSNALESDKEKQNKKTIESQNYLKKDSTAKVATEHVSDTLEKPKESKKEKAKGKKKSKEKRTSPTTTIEKTELDIKNIRKPSFLTVGLKLNLVVSFILIFFLVGVTLIATYFFQNDSITRIQETVSDKSRVLALKVQEDVRSIQSESKLISLTFDLSTALLSKQKQDPSAYRQQLLEQNQDIFYVAAVRVQNNNIIVAEDVINQKLVRKSFSNIPNFRSPLQNESLFLEKATTPNLLISNVSAIFNTPVLSASMPFIIGNDGNVQVALIVFFSMEVFVQGLEAYSQYLSYIVNERGELVGHPDSNLLVNRISFAKDEIVRKALTSPVNNLQTSYFDENKIERIGSFSKIPLADLSVVTSIDKQNALKAVNRLAWRNSLITLAALFFSMMVIYLFARSLTVPVRRLVAASNKISKGEYNINLQSKSGDEIGLLTDSFLSMAGGLQEREKMKEAFGKFVNKEIADMAMKDEIKLGGERKNVAVFFSDIRSFTAISESMEPEQVVEFLNEYMTAMVECVNATNGIVDKYIGDAIMAVWGTPISHGNDTENAINGALMMRQALIKFNDGRGGPGKPVIRIGCGINSGPVLAGQIGSSSRMEYTVIGDTVNLASRVETLNKPFGTDILISSDAYELVKDIFAVEKMKKIKVKGKSEPQQIYAVLGRKDDPHCPNSMIEVRDLIGIPQVDVSKVDADKDEVKYEISE